MNGDGEILEVLKQIRDETKQTNSRLEETNTRLGSVEGRIDETNTRLESLEGRVDQTNARLESLEGRVDQTNARLESLEGRTEFLERRLAKSFDTLTQRLDEQARRQTESEMRLATEVVGLAQVTRELRDLVARKLDDHEAVIDLQARVRVLEERNGVR